MKTNLENMNCNDLREMALNLATNARERKRIFEVAQIRWRMKAPKSHASIESAMAKEYCTIITEWSGAREVTNDQSTTKNLP